jgi:hypothetical protein
MNKLMMISIALVGCSNGKVPEEAQHAVKPSPVERGKLLTMTSGCHDCHTPWKPSPTKGAEPDFARELSGHPAGLEMPPAPQPQGPWLVSVAATNTAWSGPWGVSFTANLTPDNETGIGTWSKETFIATIRNGKHMGAGRPLLPPMPAEWYAKMSDDDLGSIYAYLRTLPPIKNKVPEPRAPQGPVSAAPTKAGQVAGR